jgi:hypothetical protein
MEKGMPSFEYEPLVMSLELETSNEEENIGEYRWGRTIR